MRDLWEILKYNKLVSRGSYDKNCKSKVKATEPETLNVLGRKILKLYYILIGVYYSYKIKTANK